LPEVPLPPIRPCGEDRHTVVGPIVPARDSYPPGVDPAAVCDIPVQMAPWSDDRPSAVLRPPVPSAGSRKLVTHVADNRSIAADNSVEVWGRGRIHNAAWDSADARRGCMTGARILVPCGSTTDSRGAGRGTTGL